MTETDAQFSLPGAAQKASAVAYGDTPSSSGIPLISGHWYSASPGAAEVDVNTLFLTDTGTSVGSTYTLISGPHRLTFRIVGAVFKTGSQADLYLSPTTLSRLDPGAQPQHFDVALQPGTSAQAYTNTVSAALGHSYRATSSQASTTQFLAVLTLITMLTVLITVVAGLGVLNTVALQIRERAHDIGVYKAIGMTPRQTLSMVVCSVPCVGLVAGIVGVPAGVFLHHAVVPVMAHAANSGHSQSLLSVYSPVGADAAGTRRVGHRARRRARPCRLGGEGRNGKLPARRIDSRGGARAGPQGARPPALTCRHEAEKDGGSGSGHGHRHPAGASVRPASVADQHIVDQQQVAGAPVHVAGGGEALVAHMGPRPRPESARRSRRPWTAPATTNGPRHHSASPDETGQNAVTRRPWSGANRSAPDDPHVGAIGVNRSGRPSSTGRGNSRLWPRFRERLILLM
ncbi:ABC transporter permease [Streptomyces sp. NPDC001093]|uniref:ABC transporter permease n=1 Tax=Streptomyces sp. NPDC001093 TaxID=3154376 RepID=UPI00332021EF